MKKLLCIGFLLTSINASAVAYYCSSAKYQSETRLEGGVMEIGYTGVAKYFGVNNTMSDNTGVFIFPYDDKMIFEFPGEQRHFCTKTAPFNWSCVRGTLKYSLVCEF